MNMENQICTIKDNKNIAITLLKAIAIIAVVIGHCSCSIPYVTDSIYMFHMPLFFFVSGFCFKEKYLYNIPLFIKKRIKGLWVPFIKWGIFFILIHNILFRFHFYDFEFEGNCNYIYTTNDILHRIKETLLFNHAEQLLGGFWFLKSLFWGCLISLLFLKVTNKCRYSVHISIIAIIFIILIFNYQTIIIPFVCISSREFAASLFYLIGYAFANKRIKIFHWSLIPLTIIYTIIGINYWPVHMDYAYYANTEFFPYAIGAILIIWSLYSILNKTAKGRFWGIRPLKFIGDNTLSILTWHFLSFKIVSLLIVLIYNLPYNQLANFPTIHEYAIKGWWIAYFAVSMITTCTIAYCNKWIRFTYLKL